MQFLRSSGQQVETHAPPKHLGDRILYAQAQDHYVRMVGSGGEHTTLMRFSDAVQRLDGHDGAQVHRSFWVARNGIAKLVRQGRRVGLLMQDGTTVPVSRTYIKTAKQLVEDREVPSDL